MGWMLSIKSEQVQFAAGVCSLQACQDTPQNHNIMALRGCLAKSHRYSTTPVVASTGNPAHALVPACLATCHHKRPVAVKASRAPGGPGVSDEAQRLRGRLVRAGAAAAEQDYIDIEGVVIDDRIPVTVRGYAQSVTISSATL